MLKPAKCPHCERHPETEQPSKSQSHLPPPVYSELPLAERNIYASLSEAHLNSHELNYAVHLENNKYKTMKDKQDIHNLKKKNL